MLFRIAGVCCAAVLCVASAQAQGGAQGFRFGVVNTETIIKEMPEAIDASKKIEEVGLKIQDTLRMMQKEFETRIEQYTKQEAMMSPDAKKKEQDALTALRGRFAAYQEEKLGQTGEVARMREGLLKPIREKVQDAINAVAKEEKIALVLDKVAGLVLYSEDKADLTFKVLDKLKRGGR